MHEEVAGDGDDLDPETDSSLRDLIQALESIPLPPALADSVGFTRRCREATRHAPRNVLAEAVLPRSEIDGMPFGLPLPGVVQPQAGDLAEKPSITLAANHPHRRRYRWVGVALAVTASVVVAVGIALVFTSGGRSSLPSEFALNARPTGQSAAEPAADDASATLEVPALASSGWVSTVEFVAGRPVAVWPRRDDDCLRIHSGVPTALSEHPFIRPQREPKQVFVFVTDRPAGAALSDGFDRKVLAAGPADPRQSVTGYLHSAGIRVLAVGVHTLSPTSRP